MSLFVLNLILKQASKMNELDFEQTSKRIVEEFLHSVVVVDDRASLDILDSKVIADQIILRVPSRGRKSKINFDGKVLEDNVITEKSVKETEPPERTNNADLDAKKLIDTFADLGLVCAVLKPIDHEAGLNEKTDHATHKSDIVILDWQIGDNEPVPGTIAISLIRKIISTDSKDRLRLIAIYTSNPDLNGIVEKITDVIAEKQANITVDNFEIVGGPIKIVIYQKAGGSNSIAPQRRVSEQELPKKLIDDFTKLTRGLLSNVALKSLGALRENTHRILSKFNSNLDSSYIAHRVLSNPPEEAESHPIPLLASELLDVLEDCGIKDLVSFDYIQKWLNYQISRGLDFNGKFTNLNHAETLELIDVLLKDGVEKDTTQQTSKNGWNARIKKLKSEKDSECFLTSLFSLPGTINVKERDMDFAILTTIRSRYESPAPLLTLGSIVTIKVGEESKYLLCIQPLCDSVRLEKNRKFSFIPLDIPIASKPNKFHLVIKDKDTYIKFSPDLKSYNTLMVEFDPLDRGEILGEITGDDWTFTSIDRGILRWVADLKFPHAQRIITQYSKELGRVGLTESDWLRRMAR